MKSAYSATHLRTPLTSPPQFQAIFPIFVRPIRIVLLCGFELLSCVAAFANTDLITRPRRFILPWPPHMVDILLTFAASVAFSFDVTIMIGDVRPRPPLVSGLSLLYFTASATSPGLVAAFIGCVKKFSPCMVHPVSDLFASLASSRLIAHLAL